MTVKVVQIIDRLNVGGPTRYVTWLGSCMSTDEFENVVITGNIVAGEGDMSWYAKDADVKLHFIPELSREISIKDITVLCKIILLLHQLQPDIVHTHKAKAGALGRIAAYLYRLSSKKNCRIVHVYHGHVFHSYYGHLKSKLFILIERLLAKLLTDVIITISQQQCLEILNKYFIGTVQQHRVIPYGLDFSTSPGPSLHNILGINTDVPIVGLVGRLCEIKNPSMFIHAAQILKTRQLNIKFVIIGDGHLRSELELLVADLDLVDTVLFTGFRDDVMNLYRDLNIITITSFNEGTPFTLIEAMNFGVPVVSTQVGGVVDLMGHKIKLLDLPDGVKSWENGLTVSSKDIVSFADAVQYLIEHQEIAKKIGNTALEFVRLNYSKQRFISDMSRLYKDLTAF